MGNINEIEGSISKIQQGPNGQVHLLLLIEWLSSFTAACRDKITLVLLELN